MAQPGPYAFRGVLGVLTIVAVGVLLSSFGSRTTLGSGTTVDSGSFRSTAVLSGAQYRSTATDFRGGEATAFMGGVNLDLRDATMEGNEAVIDVFTMMGGVEIRVPSDWAVEIRVTPVLGGVENRARPPQAGSTKRLILEGTVIMGGVDVRN